MGVVREPLAVVLGLLAFACAAGACWQAGLAWPAAASRPLARVAAALAIVLGAFGFSLGYWEVLSGLGDLVFRFDSSVTRFLFDLAAIGLPLAAIGLVLGVAATLHAAEVPARAVVPAVLAGYALGWVLDPYGLLAGPRMDPVRARYAAALSGQSVGGGAGSAGGGSAWNLFGDKGLPDLGGGNNDSEGGGGVVVILLIAFAVLAIAGGVVTAGLTFGAGRKKAKAQLERADRLRTAWEIASSR